jgi:hypothetical protein
MIDQLFEKYCRENPDCIFKDWAATNEFEFGPTVNEFIINTTHHEQAYCDISVHHALPIYLVGGI